MADKGDDHTLPEAVPRWRNVYGDGRRLGTLASCGPGAEYVFYACQPDLEVFDGCSFAEPSEAENVLVRAARRFRSCAPAGREADGRGDDGGEG